MASARGELTARLAHIVAGSADFMAQLRAVRSLGLAAWCIGAGALRNLVWDHLQGRREASTSRDVDVAFFQPPGAPARDERDVEAALQQLLPGVPWEVTDQARVHVWFEQVFGHPVPPLASLEEAVASWPEYATAVGVFLDADDAVQVMARMAWTTCSRCAFAATRRASVSRPTGSGSKRSSTRAAGRR